MARPIKETPILFGEDARRFEERMKEKRRETPEQRAKRLKDYELAMNCLLYTSPSPRDKRQSRMPSSA